MTFPVLAAIGAGTQLLGGFQNANAQQQANDNQLIYNREMYERQRRDFIEFWNMQNEYNSPAAQMARFKAAGLNPNLIYGQGNSGNASPVQTPDVQPMNFRPVSYGDGLSAAGLTGINAIYDLRIKAAQADNLQTQGEVARQEIKLKEALTRSTLTNEERARFDLELAGDLRDYSADYARERSRNLKAQTDVLLNRDIREAAMSGATIQEMFSRMAYQRELTANTREERQRIRSMVRQLEKDNTLKDLEIALRKKGITYNDPMFPRIAARILSDTFDGSWTDGFKTIWKWINE